MALDSHLEATARPKPSGGEGAHIWNLAATVLDPEVPVLTIEDLGVLRSAGLVSGTRSGTRHLFVVDTDGLAAVRAYLDGFWPTKLVALKAAVESEGRGHGG